MIAMKAKEIYNHILSSDATHWRLKELILNWDTLDICDALNDLDTAKLYFETKFKEMQEMLD